MPKLLSASFLIVQLRCQNYAVKYGKANTLSPFSIFYTEKLTSPKRREFFSRTVVMRPAGCYTCLIVLLNSRVYIWEELDMYLDLVYLNISFIAKVLRPY